MHSSAPFSAADARFLEAVVPHLGRALRVSGLLNQARLQQEAAIHGLDAVPCGVLIVTGDGRVVHANRAGGEILRRADGVRHDQSVLKGPSAKVTAALYQLCVKLRLADALTASP